jgi:hypothetical protein
MLSKATIVVREDATIVVLDYATIVVREDETICTMG